MCRTGASAARERLKCNRCYGSTYCPAELAAKCCELENSQHRRTSSRYNDVYKWINIHTETRCSPATSGWVRCVLATGEGSECGCRQRDDARRRCEVSGTALWLALSFLHPSDREWTETANGDKGKSVTVAFIPQGGRAPAAYGAQFPNGLPPQRGRGQARERRRTAAGAASRGLSVSGLRSLLILIPLLRKSFPDCRTSAARDRIVADACGQLAAGGALDIHPRGEGERFGGRRVREQNHEVCAE